MEKYSVNYRENNATARLTDFLAQIFNGETPIIVCIGTDAVSGDSLGPLTGSLLQNKLSGKTFVFGDMISPITAKEIPFVADFLNTTFQNTPILAIDAALGLKEEIGNIKVCDTPVKPGLGVNKNLSPLGTASLIAIVESKDEGKNLLSSVRLSLIYQLADMISQAVYDYFLSIKYNSSPLNSIKYPDFKKEVL